MHRVAGPWGILPVGPAIDIQVRFDFNGLAVFVVEVELRDSIFIGRKQQRLATFGANPYVKALIGNAVPIATIQNANADVLCVQDSPEQASKQRCEKSLLALMKEPRRDESLFHLRTCLWTRVTAILADDIDSQMKRGSDWVVGERRIRVSREKQGSCTAHVALVEYRIGIKGRRSRNMQRGAVPDQPG